MTCHDYFHVAEGMEFWYLLTFPKKKRGNYEKLHFISMTIEKNQFFLQFFHEFPFNFRKINKYLDIKISFPRLWYIRIIKKGQKYPFFQLISAKLLYSLCCGDHCRNGLNLPNYSKYIVTHSEIQNQIIWSYYMQSDLYILFRIK